MKFIKQVILLALTIGAFHGVAGNLATAPAGASKEGKVIFDEDFNSGKSRLSLNPKLWKIVDGSLVAYSPQMETFKLKNLKLKNFSLSYKLRMLDRAKKNDGHCGVIFSDGKGKTIRIYFRTPDVRLLIQEGKQTIIHSKLSSYGKVWEVSPQAKWNEINLTVINGYAELNVNGSLAGNFKFPITEVRALSLYAYIINCGIDDFKLIQLPATSANAANATGNPAKPAFYADYNGSTTARANGKEVQPLKQKNIVFVPGIAGQAVFIGQKSKRAEVKKPSNTLKIKYRGGMSYKDGELITNTKVSGMGTCNISGFKASEFTLKFAVKRFSLLKQDQHLGIIVKQADGRSVRFYSNGKQLRILSRDGNNGSKNRSLIKLLLKVGADAPWYDFVFKFSPEAIIITPPGQPPITLPIKNAPVISVNFYAYNLRANFMNISMTAADGKPLVSEADFMRSTAKIGKQGNALLQYSAKDLFAKSGTVMFWFQPDWDGKVKSRTSFPWYHLFTGQNVAGQNKLNLFLWHWLRLDLPRNGRNAVSLQRGGRGSWLRGDWLHLAFSWNVNGWNKLYVNGLPYYDGGKKANLPVWAMIDFKKIVKFCVGSLPAPGGLRKNANGAIDELKIYKKPLSDQAITEEYQRFMPVALLIDRRLIPAKSNETLLLTVAPRGRFTDTPVKPVKLAMQLSLRKHNSDQIVWTKDYSQLTLDRRENLTLPVGLLTPGVYRLQCTIKTKAGASQRSFKILVYQEQPATKITDSPLKLGAPFLTIDCATEIKKALYDQQPVIKTTQTGTKYLQAGAKKGNRFAFKINFDDKYLNNGPVMLEISWPDTAPRAMGLYMYAGVKKPKQHRDRLEGGIQSGDEYPLTDKMITTKYLFYPTVKSYLFEARTTTRNMPAAVASIKIRPLLEPLTELKIARPTGLPARRLGHMDEDQTFEILFNWDAGNRWKDFYQLKVVRQTIDYFAYTGQNTIAYSMLRYNYSLYDRPGSANGFINSTLFSLFLDLMAKRDMKFIGTVNQWALPEFSNRPDKFEAFKDQGVFAVNLKGHVTKRMGVLANPVHPLVRKYFLNQIKEILVRFGKHSAFAGIDLWLRQTWGFQSLTYGYGDFTVKLFADETGVKVPNFTGAKRFGQRYDFLTGKVRKAWLKWRAAKTTELVRLIAAEMYKINPKLVLYINSPGIFGHPEIEAADDVSNLNLEKFFYRNQSLDFKALKAIPNVKLAAMRTVTGYRWARHWNNRETIYDEILYKRGLWKPFLKNGSTPTWSFNRYFESYKDSLDLKNYNSYFQNADIKPWGRYFLKEWAFCLAELDAPMMLIGAQPFGTAGRDTVTREFAKAYRALPALPFTALPGGGDPVTVRYLNKAGQTWLYAVNTSWSPVELTLNKISSAVTELSNGKIITAPGGQLKISLKPYQLRSFRLSGNIVPQLGSIAIPPATITRLQAKITAIGSKLALIKKSGVKVKIYGQILKRAQKELDKQHISTVMGILYSKRIRKLNQLVKAASDGYLAQQTAMFKRGHITVNCGSLQYFKAANGTLFLPERRYAPGTYGYSGSYKAVVRNVSKIKGTANPELFASEAYDIDEYRFTVKPGIYTVKLYFKLGWARGAKPGKFVFNVDIEGKRYLDKMDIFLTSGSDFDRAFVKTISNIKVKDGILNINFSVPSGVDPTARLCNAIEVIAQ